ncbi:MAG: hypothetical protein IJ996_02535 [Clostridia bacterium]|nr:hypothetical protein [Clostridia bacterium]
MQYVKKTCILRQLKQGFSGDGKTLSGLVKVEQYGKNLAVEVSIIHFAPLTAGEYYCILADTQDRTELLPLRGKSLFNVLTEIDVSRGFCAIICFVKTEVTPIAYGVNGDRTYDWKRILGATLPPAFSKTDEEEQLATAQHTERTDDITSAYNDESIASANYFEENDDEQGLLPEIDENASAQSPSEKQGEKKGLNATQNETAPHVRHAFTTDGDGYYQSVKSEIDELFEKYPQDDTLNGAFSCSRWVRVKGESSAPEYLVGVVYFGDKAKYICYALKAQDKDNPPDEIKDVCAFVPVSPFRENDGFFVIFQCAETGVCLKPFST